MNSAFAKLDEFRGRRPPLREHVGSDRRSPSAGPSDIDRPNPIAKVSDTAPQGPDAARQSPDAAPGPSTATHVPPALGPSRFDASSDDVFVSPRGGVDRGEHVRYGSRYVSPSGTIRTKNDSGMIYKEPTPRFPSLGIVTTTVAPVEGPLQITIIVIWTFSNQDMPSLA